MYRQRLTHLEDKWEQCVNKRDWFESLKGTPGLYSIKIKGEKNIRIIFGFTGLNKSQIALLLCSFEEKNKKDYVKRIEIANERFEKVKLMLDK